jgi:glutamyl-tRNA reductase
MLGTSHARAPVALRERLAFSGDDLTGGLRALSAIAHEGVILSTCHRTELYALCETPDGDEWLRDLLAAARGVPRDLLDDATVTRDGRDAARHLLRVASGLDSVVLGEPQVLGQVQGALAAARAAGAAGPILTRLCHVALRTGKRARTLTGIARNRGSTAHAAIDLAARELGGLRGRVALVVGAGEIATLTARVLRNMDVAGLVIANRTPARAARLAGDTGGRAESLDALPTELARADAAFVAVDAARHVIDATTIRPRETPLVLVDLSLPRAVDPAVGAIPGVRCFDVDDLESVSVEQRRRYAVEVAQAEALVERAIDDFYAWWRERAAVPAIATMHARAETVRQAELERALRRLGHLSARDRAQVAALSRAIVNTLLHEPVTRIKQQTHTGDDWQDAARAIERLFGGS